MFTTGSITTFLTVHGENDVFMARPEHIRQHLNFPRRLLVSAWSAAALLRASTWWECTKAVHRHCEDAWKQHTCMARMYKSSVHNLHAVTLSFAKENRTFSYSFSTTCTWQLMASPFSLTFIHALTSKFLLCARSTFKHCVCKPLCRQSL